MTKVITKKKAATKKVAKKNITNLIIIDASGSMTSKVDEVIGGLKQLFGQIKEDMKKDKKLVNVRNIVLDFSSYKDTNILVDSKNADDLKDSIAELYTTRGMTALLDAIGKGFSMVDKNEDGVFINILTDGEENDSKEFTSSQITDLIDNAKKKNWAVTFMGTTENSIKTAKSWGISAGNTMSFADNERGVKMSMTRSRNARSTYYAASLSGENANLNDLLVDEDKADDLLNNKK